ncbi:MAG: glcA 1 [Paenibacillaceae bacterium]|jgi:beta-glucanase (GH16 family)|nr:glcA 1 [Paenibacillaceae bacterium]
MHKQDTATQAYPISGHKPSLLPGDKQWELVWQDEFDGALLDTAKWDCRLHMMGKRVPNWVDDAYYLDGKGHLVFTLENRDGIYCTTQLQTGYNFMDLPGREYDSDAAEGQLADNNQGYFTWPIGEIKEPKFMHQYGFYECRCRMQQQEGWWSAFWLQSPVIGSTLDPRLSGVEVDIMEQFSRTNMVNHNNHWSGYGCQHQSSGSVNSQLADTPDGFHVFGLEWTPDCYRYYVDGRLMHQITEPISQRPQFIMLSTEAKGYRKAGWTGWDDLKAAADFGDTFTVDYVRVFREV